ncbi:MAG: TolC family protein [Chitinophagaceae bacterium]|nr:MAG: TolC family protein [Chitinophagaceae bacterium]
MLLAFLSLFSANIFAQESKELSLKDALNYALQNYADARKARLDIENAGYQIQEVKSRALPQLNGTGGLNYNPLLQMSALPGELNPTNPGQTLLVAFGQKWNANVGVSLTQNIFDQSVFTGLKAAKTTREFYALNAQLTEEQVMEKVATAYYQVLVQRQQVVNIDSNISTTAKTHKIINGLFESGLGKKIDVDRLDVKLLNLQSQRQQIINAVAQSENQLKFLMGMPVDERIIIPAITPSNVNYGDVLLADSTNGNNRYEILVLQKQEQLLQLKKQSVKAEYYPTLSLSGNYSYQGLGNTFPIFKGMDKGANWFDVATVGLNLKVPIFNGNATKARVKQSDVEIRKLQEDIKLSRQNINLDFANAKSQISNSIIILNTQERNAGLAQKVLDNTSNNYTQGLATLTDLLDAQNALFDARNAYNASLLDYRLAEIKLIKAQGQLRTLLN